MRRHTPRRKPLSLAKRIAIPTVFFFIALASCARAASAADQSALNGSNTLTLSVRVHILSSRIQQIESGLSKKEVRELFDRVNEVWSQANVSWSVESVSNEMAVGEDELETAMQGVVPLTPQLLMGLLPKSNLHSGKWDVFFVRDLTRVVGVPGIYIANIPGVIASEVDPAGINDPGRILAHELGHSLTLQHVPCTAEGNLMSPGCASKNRTLLSATQKEDARAQASRGTPITGQF